MMDLNASNVRDFFHEKNLGITWGIFEHESGKVLGDIDFTYKIDGISKYNSAVVSRLTREAKDLLPKH